MSNRRNTTMDTEKLVLLKWPTAERLRREDRACPNCQCRGEFVSFVVPEFTEVAARTSSGVEESCGCLCGLCGWGNATWRALLEDESQ